MNKGNLTAAVREREAAFARLARVRGWTIVGAGALAAALAAAVSAAVPGRTLGAKSPVVAVHAGRPTMPPPATASQLGLQAPGNPPQPLPSPQSQPPPAQPAASSAVSGGS